MTDDPSTPVDGPSNDDEQAVLDRLTAAIRRRTELEQERRQLTTTVGLLLREAFESGYSWAEIADTAGYDDAQAAMSAAAKKSELATQPAPPPPPPGTASIAEAAATLGVTVQTIYAWIKNGRLKVADSRPRRIRVYLPRSTSNDD